MMQHHEPMASFGSKPQTTTTEAISVTNTLPDYVPLVTVNDDELITPTLMVVVGIIERRFKIPTINRTIVHHPICGVRRVTDYQLRYLHVPNGVPTWQQRPMKWTNMPHIQ
jgi:hypothetical protein